MDNPTIDPLIEELSKATTPVTNPLANAGTYTPPPANAQPLETNDFEIEDEIKDALEPGNEEPKPSRSFKATAKSFVKMFSSLLKIGARKLYPGAIMKPGDAEAVTDLKSRMQLQPPSQQSEFIANELAENEGLRFSMTRFNKVIDLIEGAPLTDDEVEMIVDPLTEVIKRHRWLQVGPEANLAFALFAVMLPRIEPLFPNLMSVLDKKVADNLAA